MSDGHPGFLRWLLLGSVLFFLTAFGFFSYRALPLLSFPFPIKYGEGVVLDQSRRVLGNIGLYPPFEEPPYLIGNYPPVYPTIAHFMPSPERAPFFGGRLLSSLAVLASGVLVALLVRREARNSLEQRIQSPRTQNQASADVAGLLAGGCFLFLPEMNDFGVLMRVDSLGLALGLLGFDLITRGFEQDSQGEWQSTLPRSRELWVRTLGCAAFFFSIYTRHSLLGLPTAAFVVLLRRGGKSQLVWPVGLLGAGIAAFLAANLVTDGEAFNHLIYLNKLPYTISSIDVKWVTSLYPWRYPLLLAGFMALWPASLRGNGRSVVSRAVFVCAATAMLACTVFAIGLSLNGFVGPDQRSLLRFCLWTFHGLWMLGVIGALFGWTGIPVLDRRQRESALLLLCGVASATLIVRAGSDVNYLFEYLTALCLVVGVGVLRFSDWRRWALLSLVMVFAVGGTVSYEAGRHTRPERRSEIARRQRILDLLRALPPGPILSQDPSIPALLGRAVEYQPFMYRKLSDAGVWDCAPLVKAVKDRRFVAIVELRDNFTFIDANGKRTLGPTTTNGNTGFPKPVSEAIHENYELVEGSETGERVTKLMLRWTYISLPR